MQSWINFWSFLFWLSFVSFISNLNNFLRLMFYSELSWVILYCYILMSGAINDDMTLLSSSIFVLGMAGLEYGIGIILMMIFKNIHNKVEIDEVDNKSLHNIYSNSTVYMNSYMWSAKKI